MRTRFTQAYKIQAVEKALTRSEITNLAEMAKSLGVGQTDVSRFFFIKLPIGVLGKQCLLILNFFNGKTTSDRKFYRHIAQQLSIVCPGFG